MRQIIADLEGIQVLMGLHVSLDDFCAKIKAVTLVVVVEVVVRASAPQSAEIIACGPRKGGATNFGCAAIYVEEQSDDNITFETSLLILISKAPPKNVPMKAEKDETRSGGTDLNEDWKESRERKKNWKKRKIGSEIERQVRFGTSGERIWGKSK